MARNYDIAEFNATDALDPTATRKLNHNFRRTLDLINEIQIGGVDTGAIASFVIDEIDDDIISLQGTAGNHEERIAALEQGGGGGGGGVTSYNDLTDKPKIEGVVLSGDVLLNSDSDATDENHGVEIHPRLTNLEIENFLRQADGLEPLQAL